MILRYVIQLTTVVVLLSASTDGSSSKSNEWQGDLGPTPCSKILIVAPVSTLSHIFVYAAFGTGLAEKCHTVDMLVPQQSKAHKNVPNLNQITSPGFKNLSDELFWYQLDQMPEYGIVGGTFMFFWYMNNGERVCKALLEDTVFREYLAKPDDHYDLVLVSPHIVDDCVLAFSYKALRAGKPWGHIFSSMVLPWVAHAFGNPGLGSYKPYTVTEWAHPMTYWQQLVSHVMYSATKFFRLFASYPRVRAVLASSWDPTIPNLEELEGTSVISFNNEDLRVFTPQEPRVADLINIGGAHCQPAKELPKNLKSWADSAENGFIFFALGSALKSDNFPEEARKKFVEAFKQLPEIQFLWKWDYDSMPGLSANVRIEKWLPQQDVLGHKNIKAFMTHGGMLSTQEATYHGVPVIGLPIAADQHTNMAKVASVDQAGVVLNWAHLTVDGIVAAIQNVLNNEAMLSSVKRRSRMFRDLPMSPLETGVFWTEYVLRHGYDTGLRSPTRDLTWIEMYCVHVGVFLLLSFTLVGVVSLWIARRIIGRLFSNRRKDTQPHNLARPKSE